MIFLKLIKFDVLQEIGSINIELRVCDKRNIVTVSYKSNIEFIDVLKAHISQLDESIVFRIIDDEVDVFIVHNFSVVNRKVLCYQPI